MIEVRKIAGKGRGIIATEDIAQGSLMEVAPVVVFPAEQRIIVDKTELSQYCFVQPIEYAKSKSAKGYIIFGLASFCNHTKEPNSYVDWIENEVGIWSHLIAKKEIKAGEEITMFYTNIDEYSEAKKFV
ncbi:SET domain-containing protein-lysine N-methyltransferase [Calothrix rhizosoleniae]|uniref:SET domain-containing protein-lysine N-methyltransferase n=1 Tax=Calothrix rhizosoleniae TaxID=888997 RepID=UPI000B49FBAD|nr:SET domain-containing protein-lysine N-methyltransferase [Calothrix rhizosoleniae]